MDTKDPKSNQSGSQPTNDNAVAPAGLDPLSPPSPQTPPATLPNTPPLPQPSIPASPEKAPLEDIPQPAATPPVASQNPGFSSPQTPQSSNIIPPASEKKGHGKLFAAIGGVVLLLVAITAGVFFVKQRQSITNQAAPNFNYHGGVYQINGSIDSNGYQGEADCDLTTGICRAKDRISGQDYPTGYVEKWVCTGKSLSCGSTDAFISHPANASSQLIWDDSNPPLCNQTIQLDVYKSASDTQANSAIVWYSGDCPPGSTPTPSPSLTPSPSPSPSLSPTPGASASPSPSPSISPTPTPTPAQGAVVASPSPTPKATPKPSPSPVAELPSAGNSTPLIVASGTGILLLIVGLVLAL